MKKLNIKLGIILCSLTLGMSSLYAAVAPHVFTTKNYTKYQSNAKVKNTWSPYPTPPGTPSSPSVRSVPWMGLKLICGLTASTCSAKIYMKTDTGSPVFVGEGQMDMSTGVVSPSELTNNGFRLTSTEPGVIEIRDAS